MSLSPPLQSVLLVLIFLLLFASGVCALWMRRRPSSTLINVRDRIRAWWVMVLCLSVAFALGPWAVTGLFIWVSFIALREIAQALPELEKEQLSWIALFYLVLPIQYLVVINFSDFFYILMLPFFMPWIACLILLPHARDSAYFYRLGRLVFTAWIGVFSLSFIPALLFLPQRGSMELLAFLLIAIQGGDIFQFLVGKAIGKRALAPYLSPNKTWEGFWGSSVLSAITGALMHELVPYGPALAASFALFANLSAILGALVLSAVKRAVGLKDWGNTISGHGGVLDRVDSLCLSAPLCYVLLAIFMV